MSDLNPAAMLLTSLLVSLVTLLVLLLSPTAAEQRTSVRLWIAGDLVGIASRAMMLLRPGMLGHGDEAWLPVHAIQVMDGTLLVAVVLCHGLALRSTLAQPATRGDVRALLATVAGCAVVLWTMPSHGAILLVTFGAVLLCSVAIGALALPWRRKFRGALLISVAMVLFALTTLSAIVHIAFVAPVAHDSHAPPWTMLALDMALSLAFTMGFLMTQFELLHHRIHQLSVTDPLTGALNRRGFMQRLQSLAGDGPVSLAIFDLDHFKRINDTLGHGCGDDVLAGFVRRLQRVARSTDVLGRWGGEEFVLLMPRTDPRGALQLVERAREAVAGTPLAACAPAVTVSAGVDTRAAPPADGWVDELLAHADSSLYRAKQRRNCVVAWTSEAVDVATTSPHVRRPDARTLATAPRPA